MSNVGDAPFKLSYMVNMAVWYNLRIEEDMAVHKAEGSPKDGEEPRATLQVDGYHVEVSE
jgi:hypothetical protein